MSNLSEQGQMGSLRTLVRKLLEEHHDFSSQTKELDQRISDSEFEVISEIFIPLRESLIDHMLVEESEIFPEISSLGLFDERISEIMQQHLDITAALDDMRIILHQKNRKELKKAFDELALLMSVHFLAEEREVFPLVISSI